MNKTIFKTMKAVRITNYASTGILSALLLGSGGAYIFNYDFFFESFTALGYPTYLIYPIAIAKILAVVAFWTPKVDSLKEWAYAGLFYDFILAFFAHLNVNDGEHTFVILPFILLSVSYFSYRKLKTNIE